MSDQNFPSTPRVDVSSGGKETTTQAPWIEWGKTLGELLDSFKRGSAAGIEYVIKHHDGRNILWLVGDVDIRGSFLGEYDHRARHVERYRRVWGVDLE